MHDEFQGFEALLWWRGTVPQLGGELVDLRNDAVTPGAVARCIVSRRADRDIDEMPWCRLSTLRPDLIGPIGDLGESRRVLDIENAWICCAVSGSRYCSAISAMMR
jgi:hypothetical protein